MPSHENKTSRSIFHPRLRKTFAFLFVGMLSVYDESSMLKIMLRIVGWET